MRKLLFVCGICLALVLGLALWAQSAIKKVEERDRKLRQDFAEGSEALRKTNGRFVYQPRASLAPERFARFLQVRTELADAFAERIEQRSKSQFHARETHNQLLGILHDSLAAREMSFAEYRAIEARWRALLAREEFADLQPAWRQTVFNRKHPKGEGLPLPEPARGAAADEVALLRKHADAMRDTLYADLMSPLLDEIAKKK